VARVEELREEGADIRAVTVWSLFGAVDWNSLLVGRNGFYEPGAFDIRAPEPRKTAIGRAAEALAKTGTFDHPLLDHHGWWRRDERYYHPPVRSGSAALPQAPKASDHWCHGYSRASLLAQSHPCAALTMCSSLVVIWTSAILLPSRRRWTSIALGR
jgi:hypothetical protein